MKFTSVIVFIFISCQYWVVSSQERKFGDVTAAELEEKGDVFFPDAPAVILYRDIDFAYGNALNVHERIKIYNSEGFEYSDWIIRFDDIKGLKAFTYNLVDGKIEKTKVSKDGIFKEEISEDEEISKITFPKVKEGSIIEIKYKVIFIGLSTLYSQSSLPIKYQRFKIYNGYYGSLSIRQNQYVKLPIRRVDEATSSLFIGENIPPLNEEDFVANVNNHRGKILMQNHGTGYQQTWSNVAKSYNNAEWFGRQLKKGDALYKKDLENLLKGETDTLTIAKKIDRHVKQTIEWDKGYSRGSEYVKSVYRDKKGDSGDINLMLVHMLRSAGLNADPILVATKRKGWVMYPQVNAFNMVLATIKINGKRYLLDGSQKNAAFGQVPLRYINDKGLIIFKDEGHMLYPIALEEASTITSIVNAKVNVEDLSVYGDVKRRISEYEALNHRDFYQDLKQDTYEESLNKLDLFDVKNLELKDVEDPEKPISIAFDFAHKDYVEKIGDKLYFEPLLIWGLKENKFNEENRLYPIDLEYPFVHKYIINYTIPQGYEIESLPEARLIKMENDISTMEFNIQQRSNQLQVIFSLHFKHYLIPADYYPALTAMYSEFLNISKSKIVLSKIQ